jgi:hypothetical protein
VAPVNPIIEAQALVKDALGSIVLVFTGACCADSGSIEVLLAEGLGQSVTFTVFALNLANTKVLFSFLATSYLNHQYQ